MKYPMIILCLFHFSGALQSFTRLSLYFWRLKANTEQELITSIFIYNNIYIYIFTYNCHCHFTTCGKMVCDSLNIIQWSQMKYPKRAPRRFWNTLLYKLSSILVNKDNLMMRPFRSNDIIIIIIIISSSSSSGSSSSSNSSNSSSNSSNRSNRSSTTLSSS